DREETGPADPLWGDADRYRPGNYLAESRPGDIVGSPFRGPNSGEAQTGPPPAGQPATPAYPEPARTGAHRAQDAAAAAYPGGTGYLSREYDFPTDEYPDATTVSIPSPTVGTAPLMGRPPAMGQPPSADESDWLRSLGNPSAQRASNN